MQSMRVWRAQVLAAMLVFGASDARADSVADFYRGRQVNLIVGYGTGGGYDVYGRLLARYFGRFLGKRGVPVYYYEDAATRPERTKLPSIRKGQYEALETKLQDPAWTPDEGPTAFNPRSGATVTGVRFPLIAFNVNLHTTDVSIADRIARAVRHISGGYRYVRAIGLALEEEGLVQVSMNLVNYARTPLPRVLETIRAEAARYGVRVAGAELVGPVPLGVLEDALKYYAQVHDFSTEQIIEVALLD